MNEPVGPLERLQRYREMRADVAQLLDSGAARIALAVHDLATVYRILNNCGFTQREIAGLVGQSQSEVSDVLAGRRVNAYRVLSRICDRLGVPRGRMGLAYDDETLELLKGIDA